MSEDDEKFACEDGTKFIRRYQVGDTIRLHNFMAKGYRVWKVIGVYGGGKSQEGSYNLIPVDFYDNEVLNVPCIMLESHPEIEKV